MKKDIKDTPKSADSGKEIEQLKKDYEILLDEKQRLFEQLQRLSADYANFQKRAPKQIADSVAYEKKAIIRSLLPSVDNFQHALAGAGGVQGEEALDKVIHGIRLVFDHMLDALKSLGVKQIEAVGRPFDPNLHEAMVQRTEADKPDNIVLEEYQPGYLLNDQILRPSKVIVNKNPDLRANEAEHVENEANLSGGQEENKETHE